MADLQYLLKKAKENCSGEIDPEKAIASFKEYIEASRPEYEKVKDKFPDLDKWFSKDVTYKAENGGVILSPNNPPKLFQGVLSVESNGTTTGAMEALEQIHKAINK